MGGRGGGGYRGGDTGQTSAHKNTPTQATDMYSPSLTYMYIHSLSHTHTYTPCLSSHLPTAGHLITTSIVWVGGESRERPSQARGSTLHLLHFGTIGEGGGGGGR